MKQPGSKPTYTWWILALTGFLVAAVVYGVQRGGVPTRNSPFSEQRAADDLRTLVGLGPRPAASEAIAKARSYIVTELEKAGLILRLLAGKASSLLAPRRFIHGTGKSGTIVRVL